MNGEAFTSIMTKKPKELDFILKNAYLSVSAVILCKQLNLHYSDDVGDASSSLRGSTSSSILK